MAGFILKQSFLFFYLLAFSTLAVFVYSQVQNMGFDQIKNLIASYS